MKQFIFTICVLILAVVGAADAKGKPQSCTNTPVKIFIEDTSTAAILSDGGGEYLNGVNGVTGVINFNSSCVGSRDVTVGFDGTSNRRIWFDFPDAIEETDIGGVTQSFSPNPFSDRAFINIRNITCRDCNTPIPGIPSTFYTKVSVAFFAPGGKKYLLSSLPDNCPAGYLCAPNFTPGPVLPTKNEPVETAWAKVTYTAPDTWVVEGEVTNDIVRSTLFLTSVKGNNPPVHYGQYSMPFKITITALAPLAQPQ
jgi:hypothetical protein